MAFHGFSELLIRHSLGERRDKKFPCVRSCINQKRWRASLFFACLLGRQFATLREALKKVGGKIWSYALFVTSLDPTSGPTYVH